MLASLGGDGQLGGPDWLVEPKLDGIRCLAFRDGESVRLLSRNEKPLTTTYPEVTVALADLASDRFVLDGEVVAFDGPRTSFARLQGRSGLHAPAAALATGIPVFYYVFDLLHLAGRDTHLMPLTERKALLRQEFDFADPVRMSEYHVGGAQQAFARACARGEEGVVVKRPDAPYAAGRSRDWLKLKCVRDQEFVVGGFTPGTGTRLGFGALLVGYYDAAGDLRYAGKVGTGFDSATLTGLAAQLVMLEQPRAPFLDPPREPGARWVDPLVVVAVGFGEWTARGLLRHPRYLGLRLDKAAGEVHRERL
jgi:bifunctional non-homologous end joining protein LigD